MNLQDIQDELERSWHLCDPEAIYDAQAEVERLKTLMVELINYLKEKNK